MHQYGYFYIMTNAYNTVLYAGATTDLSKRVQEHKNKVFKNSFTLKYNVEKLVYFEAFSIAGDKAAISGSVSRAQKVHSRSFTSSSPSPVLQKEDRIARCNGILEINEIFHYRSPMPHTEGCVRLAPMWCYAAHLCTALIPLLRKMKPLNLLFCKVFIGFSQQRYSINSRTSPVPLFLSYYTRFYLFTAGTRAWSTASVAASAGKKHSTRSSWSVMS